MPIDGDDAHLQRIQDFLGFSLTLRTVLRLAQLSKGGLSAEHVEQPPPTKEPEVAGRSLRPVVDEDSNVTARFYVHQVSLSWGGRREGRVRGRTMLCLNL